MDMQLQPHEARVEVNWARQAGTMPDPVIFDSRAEDIKTWVTEAIRTGSIPGIAADPNVDLTDYMVEPYAAEQGRDYNVIYVRPKTPFG